MANETLGTFVAFSSAPAQIFSVPVSADPPPPPVDEGWLFYKDTQYTASAKRFIAANTRTVIDNNALSTINNTKFKPKAAMWWNKNTNKFVADAEGDVFMIRVNLSMSSPANNQTVTLDLDINTANLPIVQNFPLTLGANTTQKETRQFQLAASAGLLNNNGATLNITCSADVYIWDVSFLIQKTFAV